MQISYSNDLIAITIQEDSKTFYFLQNLVNKNFKKKIGKKEKIIIFKQNEETIQRKYFLKLISKIYKRKNSYVEDKVLEKIKYSYNKNIKLTLLKANQISQCIDIDVKIDDNYVVLLNFTMDYSILVTYLKNYFKNHLVSYRKKTRVMTIYPNSDKTIELLENLLSQKELLGSYVKFKYNKKEYEEYKLVLNEKQNRKKRYFALFSLLEEYYSILGCEKLDTFDIIRKRYLKLVKQYHPDRLDTKDLSLNRYYKKKFLDIQYAYEMLKVHYTHETDIAITA